MDKIRRRIYTLELDEVIEKDHWLGIHTSLEPYQLAFIINQNSRLTNNLTYPSSFDTSVY